MKGQPGRENFEQWFLESLGEHENLHLAICSGFDQRRSYLLHH